MYITKLINANLIQFERRESEQQLITCPKLSKTKFFSDDESRSFVFAYLKKRTFVGIAVSSAACAFPLLPLLMIVYIMTTETCTYEHTLERV